MQNTNQITLPESSINTSLTAPYSLNTYYNNLFFSNLQRIFSSKNQHRITTAQNRNDSSIPFEKSQEENTTQDQLLLKRNNYSVHLINSFKLRIKTNTLIKRMYASRGYKTEFASAFSYNPDQITFLVSVGEIAAGTVTLGTDSGKGLIADELYQEEIDVFRKKGRKVCELSKFALDPELSSKEMIASLFQVAYIYAHNILKATDFFCEVNPRHAGPQKRMFGFRTIGKVETCPRVNAPAVLLHLELAYIQTQIYSRAGSFSSADRSLYSYFIPQTIIDQSLQHATSPRKTTK